MKILSFNNAEDLANQTEVLFRQLYDLKQRALRGFLPTGRSAEGFYRLLRATSFWKMKFQILQIDEFTQSDRLFYTSLKTQVIDPLGLENHFEAIEPSWSDEQMQTHIKQVLSLPIDFALLGLGPNGHIGFHEPGCGDQNFLGGRVRLSPQSFKRVAGASAPWALTFGAGSFLKAEKILMIVTGEEKAQIYQKFLETELTGDLPASLLKQHPDFTVLTTF